MANPFPTVYIIMEIGPRIVLIERANPPFGWATLGGFVDYGESLENAARREAFEEKGLKAELFHQFHTYSDPLEIPTNTIFLQYLLLRPLELQKPVQMPNKPGFLSLLFLSFWFLTMRK